MQRRIVGMHDSCPLELFDGKGGWMVFPVAVGHDPMDLSSGDYSSLAEAGIEAIVRFQHGWGDGGCIPVPEQYAAFAQRIRNYVRFSAGCRVWLIGNEFNHSQERPRGRAIQPRDAADCYALVERMIHTLPEHETDWVVPGAVAPWNIETTYPGNESGDWTRYYYDLMDEILARGARVDAICLHAYTHGHDPALVDSNEPMSPIALWGMHFWHFREFESFVSETPHELWDRPILITECNPGADAAQGKAWRDEDGAWMERAFAYVDRWNRENIPQIACLCPYRWAGDEHAIEGKGGVIGGFQSVVAMDYVWAAGEPLPPEEEMVKNPGFEGPYERQAGTASVANGWRFWHNHGDPPAEHSQGPLVMPEYKEAPIGLDAHRVIEGESAQCWFVQFKVMDGGIYQEVPVERDRRYQFAVMAQTWCSNSNDPRAADGEMYLSLGLDPYGRTVPRAQGIVWSPWARLKADYVEVSSADVMAQSEVMTVYIRAWNKWKMTHNDVYVDRLEWYAEGKPPDPPPGTVEVDYERIARETSERVMGEMVTLMERMCDAIQDELAK